MDELLKQILAELQTLNSRLTTWENTYVEYQTARWGGSKIRHYKSDEEKPNA